MVKESVIGCKSTGLSKYNLFITISFFSILLNLSVKAQNSPNNFRYPAEFEPQQAVWFGWEKIDTSFHHTVVKIIKSLQGRVPLKMAISSYELGESAIEFLDKNGIDLDQIEFNVIPGDRFWIRDNGATFLVNNEGQLGVADFQWSSYGYYDWLLKKLPNMKSTINIIRNMPPVSDDRVLDEKMAIVTGAEIIKSELVIEGGAMETNGKGVLLQCEQVTLERNPGWTKKQIENEYRRVLNISKVIWLKKGTADDDRRFNPYKNYQFTGTGGHLDEFVRFADANTILLGWINEEDKDKHPLNRVTYERMKDNLKILETATDQDGNLFRIIKIPLPSIIELDSDEQNGTLLGNSEFSELLPTIENSLNTKTIHVATSSYLNFMITNGMIINASYVNHGTTIEYEERVKAIFKEVFPDREQVWIDVFSLNKNGGGIHCITHHEPVSTKKGLLVIPKT